MTSLKQAAIKFRQLSWSE